MLTPSAEEADPKALSQLGPIPGHASQSLERDLYFRLIVAQQHQAIESTELSTHIRREL